MFGAKFRWTFWPFLHRNPHVHVRCPQIVPNCSRKRSLEHCHSHAFFVPKICPAKEAKPSDQFPEFGPKMFSELCVLNVDVIHCSETKNQSKEEVFGRTSLRTSGQKLRSGPPNLKTKTFWLAHAARTSTKKTQSEKLGADFPFPNINKLLTGLSRDHPGIFPAFSWDFLGILFVCVSFSLQEKGNA